MSNSTVQCQSLYSFFPQYTYWKHLHVSRSTQIKPMLLKLQLHVRSASFEQFCFSFLSTSYSSSASHQQASHLASVCLHCQTLHWSALVVAGATSCPQQQHHWPDHTLPLYCRVHVLHQNLMGSIEHSVGTAILNLISRIISIKLKYIRLHSSKVILCLSYISFTVLEMKDWSDYL